MSQQQQPGAGVAFASATPPHWQGESTRRFCSQKELLVPPPPTDDADHARAVLLLASKWLDGTTITWAFMSTPPLAGGPASAGVWDSPQQRADVRAAWDTWAAVGINLHFRELPESDATSAMVRIRFDDDGSWSYVGAANRQIPLSRPTMNFGWSLSGQPGTAEHEVGHALGLQHEHQNPRAGIEWNVPAVIAAFSRPPNSWSMSKIRNNILNKLTPLDTQGTRWDPTSVMEYGFGPGMVLAPAPYDQTGIPDPSKLSALDKAAVRALYPPPPPPAMPALAPGGHLELADLKDGAETALSLTAATSGMYVIQVAEGVDVVLSVSKAGEAGASTQLDADANAGKGRGAVAAFKAESGSEYIVRLRKVWAAGGAAAAPVRVSAFAM
jgi:hypothetical protein